MLRDMNTAEVESAIKSMARQVVTSAFNGGEGHVPSALSILDIVYAVYDSNTLSVGESDDFILSKGHASLGLYAILAAKERIPLNWVESFANFDSPYGGHPHRLKIKDVVASTGSLGHGLPIAAGIAFAKKVSNESGKTIVLLGDGEINEGTTWEASLFSSHHNLTNLVGIIDFNQSGDRAIKLEHLDLKFKGLGWDVKVVNGHDVREISDAINHRNPDLPTMIIAETIKGFRIKEIENNPAWHHTKLSNGDLSRFLEELA